MKLFCLGNMAILLQSYGSPSPLVYVLLGLLVLFILFLALREVACWYFKINERVTLLKRIDAKLDAQDKSSTASETAVPEA